MIILGIAAVAAGGGFPISSLLAKTDFVLNLCGGSALVAGGICYFVAAARRYRGHGAFIVGIVLIVIGFVGLGKEIEDALAGRSEDRWFQVGLILFFSGCGALSLWSGHKLHRCSLELERVKKEAS